MLFPENRIVNEYVLVKQIDEKYILKFSDIKN